MFGLSAGHLLILLVVILIFGARRLPELGSSLGKGLRNFKAAMDGEQPKIEQAQTKTDNNQQQQS